jgi:hypothetical protein
MTEPTPTCSRTGCEHPAEGILQLVIPATGWPINHNPIKLAIGVPVCYACFPKVKVDDFIDPTLPKGSIYDIVEVVTRGKCPPDWERAYFALLAFDSEEYRVLREQGGPS